MLPGLPRPRAPFVCPSVADVTVYVPFVAAGLVAPVAAG